MSQTLNASAWPQLLSASITCLSEAADAARTTYQRADATAEQLRTDADAADKSAEGAHAAQVIYEGYARRQYAGVLHEIAFSHAGLALSLARVWHRSAYAYAYGVATTLADLHRRERPELAHVTYHQVVPAPSGTGAGSLRAVYRAACDAHVGITPGEQPYGRHPWAKSAEAWHLYATEASRLVHDVLSAASAEL